MTKTINYLAIAVLALLAFAFGIHYAMTTNKVMGSTVVGNDYKATTTRSFAGTALTNFTVLKTGQGALARVTVTGANTGIVRFWDATTTNITLRQAVMASTSILLAEIPASAAANTYDFDIEFTNGLLYEVVSGLAPTSTPVWR